MHLVKNIPLVTIVLCFISSTISCKNGNDQLSFDDIQVPDMTREQRNDSANRQNTINEIAYQISANATVDAGAVAIDGRETEQYKRFLWLKKFATEQELIKLTQHKSGNVKAYAFRELCDRNAPSCKKILEQHLKDKTTFDNFSGCLISPTYVNIFYLQLLSDKLNTQEIKAYKKVVSGNFSAEEWELIERMNSL